MSDETSAELDDEVQDEDAPDDVLELLDRLEALGGSGHHMLLRGRVVIEESEFYSLLDRIRTAVPYEIRQAQGVIQHRSDIITDAQQEAAKILDTARSQAEYIISEQGVLNEARQRGEELLQQVEQRRMRSMGEIDAYALQQIAKAETAVQDGLTLVMDALQQASRDLEQAKRHVGE